MYYEQTFLAYNLDKKKYLKSCFHNFKLAKCKVLKFCNSTCNCIIIKMYCILCNQSNLHHRKSFLIGEKPCSISDFSLLGQRLFSDLY